MRSRNGKRGGDGTLGRGCAKFAHFSRAEIQMTQAIVDVAKPLGIAVHDHVIVDKEGHAIFKGLKLI